MANERLFYDIWLCEPNLVYREVPFVVVSSWFAEGRILADDKVRPSGQVDWHRLAEAPILLPHLPRPAPTPVESSPPGPELTTPSADTEDIDQPLPTAVARVSEDDDPDMIPLIDISLVLLIFFLMTGKSLTGVSTTEQQSQPSVNSIFRSGSKLPRAKYAELIERPDIVAVSIGKDVDGRYLYFVADRWKDPLELHDVLSTLGREIKDRNLTPRDITILLRADENIPFSEVQALTIGLEALECAEIFAVTIEDAAEK
jgi:biopolymer transport protein ExbD